MARVNFSMADWQHMFARRTERMKASDIREAFKLAERGDIISFAGGFPSPESFPKGEIADIARHVAWELGESSLQYGPTEGFYQLRELIAKGMRARGVPCRPEQVLVTNGSQQALDLIGKLLLNPGDGVIVEKPAYVGGLNALSPYEPEFVGIPLDADGLCTGLIDPELTERRRRGGRVKACYTVPNFQNPAGVTLSAQRRRELLEAAARHGFCIVEDDPYGDLRFEGDPLEPIKALDREERVLYLGSFSKVFLPGFRLGYVVGPEEVIQRLAIAKQGADLCSNSFGQRVILEAVRRGLFEPHRERIIGLYRAKRDLMLECLSRHFPPEVTWTHPQGGFFIWVTLPEGMDAKKLLPEAVAEERVAYVSGGAFFVDGSGANTIRLAYSQASDAEIVEGIRRLGRFLASRLPARRARRSSSQGMVGAASQAGIPASSE